jgi:hypothetical protein
MSGGFCIKDGTEFDYYEAETSSDCTLDLDYPGGIDQAPDYCGPPNPY